MPPFPIRRALIAVHDKTGIAEFARALVNEFGIEIISTGGTAQHLKEAGVPVTLVEEETGFPEMLDGRVKTLHPRIHAAILADRDNSEHMRQLEQHGIKPIDMVVVNLYPFDKTTADPRCTFEQAVEMIDIGGPCLLRAAAKNHKHVLAVPHAREQEYPGLLRILRGEKGVRSLEEERRQAAFHVFAETAEYDSLVWSWLGGSEREGFPNFFAKRFFREAFLRYGENPHQTGDVLVPWDEASWPSLFRNIVRPKSEFENNAIGHLSHTNVLDADAALGLCAELTRAAQTQGEPPKEPKADNEPRPRFIRCGGGRAAPTTPIALNPAAVFAPPDLARPAWLLTWTTYGSWLPGDDRGFVSRAPRENGGYSKRNEPKTPYDVAQGDMTEAARARMKGSPVHLEEGDAQVADAAFVEAARTHGVSLIAYSIMSDHIHLLCQAEHDGSKLLNLFKGVSSRRLGQWRSLENAPRWWTEGGSKRHIRRGENLAAGMDYVCGQEGALLVRCVEAFRNKGAPGVTATARPEGRGSLPATAQPPPQRINCGRGSLAARGSSICCFIKHTNACGAAFHANPIEAYRKAYLGDPRAAMGGVLAVNFEVTTDFAQAVMETYQRWGKAAGAGGFFVEVWVAPSFDEKAVSLIREGKEWGKRVRLLAVPDIGSPAEANPLQYRSIAGGMLVQTPDVIGLNEDQWKVVTQRRPTEAEMADLRLAWLICKHTKSNAITICKDGMLIGNGAGQMSRVMSCRIATWLAKENGHADMLKGAVAASDAFFPFRDGPDILIDAGVTAIIQPGGSKRDDDTIAACNERGIAMIFTGTRHFRH